MKKTTVTQPDGGSRPCRYSVGMDSSGYDARVPPGTQREWSLADLFNMEKFKGSARLWSDVPVAISDQRVTTTLRGESVEGEIGYVDEASLKDKKPFQLPTISDGAGVATAIILVNPTETEIRCRIQFDSSDGQPSDIVLR